MKTSRFCSRALPSHAANSLSAGRGIQNEGRIPATNGERQNPACFIHGVFGGAGGAAVGLAGVAGRVARVGEIIPR